MKRHLDREEAFKKIFALGFYDDFTELPTFSMEEEALFVREIFKATTQNLSEIDLKIQKNLNKWKFDRINKVDLALIRLAICEINFLKTPPAVAISEVLVIAEDYNGNKTFINGILANI